jgi:(1->4)-alpha-D-glucan 1-alpha-D-glucosylmutase
VPYLSMLGVTHLYCSPYLRARPGSTHGYDVVDHSQLNPEIGSVEEFELLDATLKAHGMSQILDLVPNHMGVMGADNRWWLDVLENGRSSVYAEFFDIDWEPPDPTRRDKLLVPVLGGHYGQVLESGELKLAFDANTGSFGFYYHEHSFPLDPRDYPLVLERALRLLGSTLDHGALLDFESLITAFGHLPPREEPDPARIQERSRDKELHKQRLARLCQANPTLSAAIASAIRAINGTPGEPASFDPLHDLLERQAYRVAYWRVASDDINYRRFFDINELAALRQEHEPVFEATHRLVFDWIAAGKVEGLRIDHPDGLYDPLQYLQRLQNRVAALVGGEPEARDPTALPIYLIIEKISASHERALEPWPVHGTTGYRFANIVNGVFIDSTARDRMERIYHAFVQDIHRYEDVVYSSKRLILRTALAGELNVIANRLARIARADRNTRDYTLNTLRQAVTEVVACFPVYRTYIADRPRAPDRRYIQWAIAAAKRHSRAADITVFDFVQTALLAGASEGRRLAGLEMLAFARKFQQLTAPVNAKGLEDTAFYRYNRLVSLNEVGGDPEQFGVTLSAFHGASQDRAKRWPHTLLSTSTHDSKRAEDVRLRINVLSELPAAWRLAVRRWSRINRSKKIKLEDGPAPSANDEYLLYQTLIGTWPLEPLDEEGLASYRARIQVYMVKAVREAKVHSSWINVNTRYEAAVSGFVHGLLGKLEGNLFLDDFVAGQRLIAWLAMLDGLSQTVLKLASPGVPDTFQGTELWDFSLVDPDNRRPVDFHRRGRLLDELCILASQPSDSRVARVRAMLDRLEDGRAKLLVIHTALQLRRALPDLFQRGEYVPVWVDAPHDQRIIAFARRFESGGVIVVAPRLLAAALKEPGTLPLGAPTWSDAGLALPWLSRNATLRDMFTGRPLSLEVGEHGARLALSEALRDFPVALVHFELAAAQAG